MRGCLPLFPIAASPSLPFALQRLARTPTARLAINYLLRRQGCPPQAASSPAAPVPYRCLGAALYVDRLVSGGIIGTRLNLGPCPQPLPEAPLEPNGEPTIGKNIDLTA
jgi:hypothetical protein